MNILVDTFFTTDPNGHGGNHRTAQIAELIKKASIDISPFDRTLLTTRFSRYLAGINAILNPKTLRFITKYRLKVGYSPVALAFCGFQRQLYQTRLRQHSGSKLLLWEATKNYVAPYVASDVGFRVVAMPHNLESLVPKQDAFFEGFETEVSALAKANVVFCISREEEWLLRTKGINAHYLPYYPPEPVLERLLNIRDARSHAEKRRFLILGNANNPPTEQGMIEQLQWLTNVRKAFEFQVDIVGFGTERLSTHVNLADFKVHGSVSPETLNDFLIHAQAALIHQTPTSGALTRIPEFLVAGIPMIANSNACRSTDEYAGVYRYDDWLELADLMGQPLPVPDLLPRPIAAEKRFIDCLKELAS
ncbi:glycosyltransferase family 4 protein [Myxacorys almedinensis]|uniref:Glycosyltransferase n=1 Tax=Myxacorys almedinensis A TaxID=2690445 RepID=A0A8J7Z966_9CYAN|nr:glycosyltransferase family 4 protein [Myxacorys almedinensis]NDJ18733.1 hypothetical protein [Myxacorys almedinensis A]